MRVTDLALLRSLTPMLATRALASLSATDLCLLSGVVLSLPDVAAPPALPARPVHLTPLVPPVVIPACTISWTDVAAAGAVAVELGLSGTVGLTGGGLGGAGTPTLEPGTPPSCEHYSAFVQRSSTRWEWPGPRRGSTRSRSRAARSRRDCRCRARA